MFRAMQMLLVMFCAEELKRTVMNLIQATDDAKARIPTERTTASGPSATTHSCSDPRRKHFWRGVEVCYRLSAWESRAWL